MTEPQTTEVEQQESGNAEAAKYRRQLRDTETERDALRGQVESMRRAEVERLAAPHLTKPAGLWLAGTTLDDLLDPHGNVDTEKVQAAALAAAETLGLAQPVVPAMSPREGGNGRPRMGNGGFAGAFRG